MANRLESIWDALRNSMNPEEEQATTIGNSYSQGQGYNYPVPNEWGNSNQTPESVRESIDLGRPPIVQNMDYMNSFAPTPFDMASIPKNTTSEEYVAPVEEPGFLDTLGQGVNDMNKGIGDYFGSEENMANLAIGLNSMRLNPDANLAALMGKKLERLEKTKGSNKTAEQLRKMGRSDLAEAVESGSMDGKTAWSLAHKAPSAFQEKLDFIEGKTPDEIQSYKDAGVLGGGGTTINMGNEKYYDQIKSDAATMQTEYRERGQNARATMNNFNQLDQALSNYGETGPKANTIQGIRELASSVGMEYLIDEDKMSDGQYLKAVKNKMVAQQLMLQKGPQTDFDAEFAGTYIPGLGISAEANTSLMNASKSISQQQLILSKLVRTARMTQPENAMEIISKADALAEESPMAMKSADGKWTTFIEFYNDPEYAKNTGLERLTAWSEIYKLRMAE